MVRLDPTRGDESVGTLGERVGDYIFELAHLIPAECEARVAVVSFDPDGSAAVELVGEAGESLDIGRAGEEQFHAEDVAEWCGEGDHGENVSWRGGSGDSAIDVC
jgi:hypothetical protein